jgi:hypothetical protein
MLVGSFYDRQGVGASPMRWWASRKYMYFLCFLTEREANVPNRLATVKNYYPGIFQLTTDSALAEVGVLAPGNKTKTFYVSTSFCGCPIGWRLASSPNREAVTVVHATDPNGASRYMLCWKSGSFRRGLWLLDDEEGAFGVCRK